MKKLIFCLLFCNIFNSLHSQNNIPDSLALRFHNQLTLFPQEKIHIHTDKSYYLLGEKIWFRAYLVDAVFHIPVPASRYVYVELINPLDSVVTRVKIREVEEAYHGCLLIPDDILEGDYTLRAYTTFMRSQDENYFFTKSVHIGNPNVRANRIVYKTLPNNEFDVSFYPEGGSLLLGTACKVVFKAMKSNGLSTNIFGVVYDQTHKAIAAIKSDHLGMGSFTMTAEKDKTYYAVCEDNDGYSKCFDLPVAVDNGYALFVNRIRGNVYVSVLKSADVVLEDELYLLAHTRGMVHMIERWDHQKKAALLPVLLFPSGVLHLLLLNSRFNVVSERLVFINNDDQAQVAVQFDKTHYLPRSLVKSSITLTDKEGQPLPANFSVSVTSDRAIVSDSTANILTQLLLTSDLRGYIENPASYFQHTTKSSVSLDLLMCTQGWRRYNIAEVAQGHFSHPTFPLEIGMEISGNVRNVLSNKPIENAEVIAVSLSDSYLAKGQTNKEGYFWLPVGEWPDSIRYAVSVKPQKSTMRLNLTLEKDSYPKRTLPAAPSIDVNPFKVTQYVDEIEPLYTIKDSIRTTQLMAAVVTAKRKAPSKSLYYSEPDYSMTQDKLETYPAAKDIFDMLALIPSVHVSRSGDPLETPIVFIGGISSLLGSAPPLLLVDNIPTGIEFLSQINVNDIAQIDILRGANASIYGSRSMYGVLSIFTKDGRSTTSNTTYQPPHIKTLSLLGYQQPVEFYAPKYETDLQRNNPKPDLRTTIHWQPVVQIDSLGLASFEFYTADEPTSYTVIIEGVAKDGSIIRREEKLWGKQ